MVSTWIVCLGLLSVPPSLFPDPLAAYQTAKAEVGRDPDAHVKLALWCEANGLEAERVKHLALAVLIKPDHARARGLLGLVAYRNGWQNPDLVAAKIGEDEAMAGALAEYNARREQTPDTVAAQWNLALWCEKKGLRAEMAAHLTTVTRLEPGYEAAWKKLGCIRHHGRWMRLEQIKAEIAETEAQAAADRHWNTELVRWRTWLGDEAQCAAAEEKLASVTDPRAVSAVYRTFAKGNPDRQAHAVRLLAQISAPKASKALALLAVSSESEEVRRSATDVLVTSDPRDFVDLLIDMLRDPVPYEVKPVKGPGLPGSLMVAGREFNTLRLYSPPPLPKIDYAPGDLARFDEYGLLEITKDTGTIETSSPMPGIREVHSRHQVIPIGRMREETRLEARVAQKQLLEDVAKVELHNDRATAINARIVPILQSVTGMNFADGPAQDWKAWWTDQQGYSYRSERVDPNKPTMTENVALAYRRQSGPIDLTGPLLGYRQGHSCFGAGTRVRTLGGLRAIETLKVGDQVLTQDTQSGTLGYEPIVAVFHNAPNETYRLTLGTETVVVTGLHRFWKPGQGWVMARNLKPGQVVRTLGGLARVESVSLDQVRPVFNLEVARGQSFFVGEQGLLVHDNTQVTSVPEPFDAAPTVAVLPRKAG